MGYRFPEDKGTARRGAQAPPPPLESLYQEVILSHFRNPRNHGELADPTSRVHMNNPTCGDEIVLCVRVEGGRIEAVAFSGQGCSISQASASMMSALLEGRSLAEARRMYQVFRDLVQGKIAPREASELGDLRALAGVARFPARVRCAMLGWNALTEAVGEGGAGSERGAHGE